MFDAIRAFADQVKGMDYKPSGFWCEVGFVPIKKRLKKGSIRSVMAEAKRRIYVAQQQTRLMEYSFRDGGVEAWRINYSPTFRNN